MPEVIRFAKGTASEHLNFTGENGEITLICDDTPNRKVTGVIRLHDGQTVGGIPFGGSQLLNDMHDVNAANTIEFQVMTVDANGQFYFANTVETIADGTISGDKIYGGTISTSAAVFEGSSSNAIVRITQTGTGNALVVEDSANPDSTPFVVDSSGNLMLGGAANSWSTVQAVQIDRGSISGYAGNSYLSHNFYASSGGNKYIASGGAAQIRLVDDTIIFNRASSGSADATLSFSESMRIDSSGNVGIETINPVAKNHIRGSGTSGQVTASWMLENASSGTAGMDITGAAGSSRWRFLRGAGVGTGTNTLSEAMCIVTEGASAGNVGIGTNSPTATLHISGNSKITGKINSYFDNDSTTFNGMAFNAAFQHGDIATPQSSTAYVPHVGGTTVVTNYGYRSHAYFGTKRSGSPSWGSGAYIAYGGNDAYPTKEFLFDINGNFTASGTKNFKIKHPLPELNNTHVLIHAAIEGPNADLIYRGIVTLVDGTATVNIDEISRMTQGTFVLLTKDIQCFTSNESDWVSVRGSVSGNILTIEAQDSSSTANVSWMVVAKRNDIDIINTHSTDDSGELITEYQDDIIE